MRRMTRTQAEAGGDGSGPGGPRRGARRSCAARGPARLDGRPARRPATATASRSPATRSALTENVDVRRRRPGVHRRHRDVSRHHPTSRSGRTAPRTPDLVFGWPTPNSHRSRSRSRAPRSAASGAVQPGAADVGRATTWRSTCRPARPGRPSHTARATFPGDPGQRPQRHDLRPHRRGHGRAGEERAWCAIGQITHSYVGDLTLYLIAPDGRSVMLVSHKGADGQNFTNTVFDDAAAGAIRSTTAAPFTGTFRPAQPLSAMDGAPLAGTWKLKVVDDSPGVFGSVDAWARQHRCGHLRAAVRTTSSPVTPARPADTAGCTRATANALRPQEAGARRARLRRRARQDRGLERRNVIGATVAAAVDEERRRPRHLAGVRVGDVLCHRPRMHTAGAARRESAARRARAAPRSRRGARRRAASWWASSRSCMSQNLPCAPAASAASAAIWACGCTSVSGRWREHVAQSSPKSASSSRMTGSAWPQ